MNAMIRALFIGRPVRVNHPETRLNPRGREWAVVTDVRIEGDRVWVRASDSMWFGENSILEFGAK